MKRKTKYQAEQFLLPLEVEGTRAAKMRCDCGTKAQADAEMDRIRKQYGSDLIDIRRNSKAGFYWVTYSYRKDVRSPLFVDTSDFKQAMLLSDAMRSKL